MASVVRQVDFLGVGCGQGPGEGGAMGRRARVREFNGLDFFVWMRTCYGIGLVRRWWKGEVALLVRCW